MAPFAQLDENNLVTQVTAVNNDVIVDADGVEHEALGVTFLQDLFGADTVWVQTSYNKNIRKNYASVGFSYDANRDAFIPPQPYASWSIDEETCLWQAPINQPLLTEAQQQAGIYYGWDENAYQADTIDPKTLGWVLYTSGEE